MVWLLLGILVGLAAGVAYVRFAPSHAHDWHVDLASDDLEIPGNAQVFCIRPTNAYGPIKGDPTALLARLDSIALATPRTLRLAGSLAQGRITWETRSALIGFPDYTTAQLLPGPSLCILARQRFGKKDFGVNAARVGNWAKALLGLPAPPPMNGPVRRFLAGE